MSTAHPLPWIDIAPYLVDDPGHTYQPNPGLFGIPIRKDWGVKDVPVVVIHDGGKLVGYIMKADLDALPSPTEVERIKHQIKALLKLAEPKP